MSNVKQVWNSVLKELESQVSALTFDLWIKNLQPVCIYRDRLVLATETGAHHNICEKRFHETIKKTSQKLFPIIVDVEIITSDMISAFEQYKEAELNSDEEDTAASEEQATFFSSYTFDNFVVGKSNEFAAAVAKAVAEKVASGKPNVKYNPLFLYGGVGLGKTHLMHAIGNYIKEQNPKIKAIYVPTEKFINELLNIFRNSSDADARVVFRKKYRTVDILMLDDIQSITNRASTQEEIFYTFNDLYLAGKQIIISSDRPPKEIVPLEERLRTRFCSGVIADISQPDLDMRIAILQKMCLFERADIKKEVLRFIAEKITSNIRELKGLLTRVISYASLTGSDVNDMDVVNAALKDYAEDAKEVVTIQKIADIVCRYYNLDFKDLTGKKKNKEIVVPRQICIYLITEFLSTPLIAIGEFFGGRDHTTIMHARDKISATIRENKIIASQVKDLKDAILNR